MTAAHSLDFLAIAASSQGVVNHRQLRHAGVNLHQVRRAEKFGALVRLTPTVLRVVGSVTSERQVAASAVLDAGNGSSLSHDSAAAMWGLPGYQLLPAHVSHHRVHSSREVTLANVHEYRKMFPHHVLLLDDIRVTTPARTIFDLSRKLRPGRLARSTDWALSHRLLKTADLHQVTRELGGRGVAGTAAMRQLIEARPLDYIAPESGLEARLDALWNECRLPSLRRQVNLGSELEWVGRVDFFCPPLPLVIEMQSAVFHSSVSDLADDRRRINAIRQAGFPVWEVSEVDVFHNPDKVKAEAIRLAGRS